MADCITCEDGKYACPNPCPFIPPGSMAEQAMADLAIGYEPKVFDGDW